MDPLQPQQPSQQMPVEQQTQPQTQGMYQPVGVPAMAPSHSSGMTPAIVGIVCAVLSLLFIPLLFGTLGIILGKNALGKGQKVLGMTTIILSAICMVIGTLLGIYVHLHPELLKPGVGAAGAVVEVLYQ